MIAKALRILEKGEVQREVAMNIPIQHRPGPLLSPRDAAAYLGISKSFLDKRRVRGDGPRFRKIGRRVAYALPDIDQWLDGHAHSSTSSVGGQ